MPEIATSIGQVLTFQSVLPMIGVSDLTGYTDDVVGVTVNRYFNKEFKYSLDGINYKEYQPLTDENIDAIPINIYSTFFINYRYTRAGIDNTGTLEWNSTTLEGTFEQVDSGEAFQNSIFNEFLDYFGEDVTNWCLNVLRKIYASGIVPVYIIRGKDKNAHGEDDDYIAFWKTISCLFAIMVGYAKVFENFTSYEKIFRNYVLQKGIYICPLENVEDVLYITTNYYKEISNRGTRLIVKKKGEGYPVKGELLRLISYNEDLDEFYFLIVNEKNFGWNINNASPLYKGVYQHFGLNKAYEDSQDFVNLAKYNLAAESGSFSIETDGDKEVLNLVADEGTETGMNLNKDSITYSDLITVNPYLAYQITFWVKTINFDDAGTLKFGVWTFNKDQVQIDTRSILNGSVRNIFFENVTLPNEDNYYFVRGTIFPYGSQHQNITNSKTNILQGVNLKFGSPLSIKLAIVLGIVGGPSLEIDSKINIWDLKMKPLNLQYSTGFIQTNNFLNIWSKNNNVELTEAQIENFEREKLIPYNSVLKHTWLT